MASLGEIRKTQERWMHVLEEILALGPMIPGSYSEVYSKCGKQSCRCNDGQTSVNDEFTPQVECSEKVPPRQFL